MFFIARAQYRKSQKYEKMVLGFGNDALSVYESIKSIDDRQMFEKDDDVGIIFSQIFSIIEDFNNKTQSKTE